VTATVSGVRFSGARQAGHGIRLATATATADGLRIESCTPAADRFGAVERAPCLGRLREWLREADVAGLTAPFGVPAGVHGRDTWHESLEWATTVATDAEGFAAACADSSDANGPDGYPRRETDGPIGAPSPCHPDVVPRTFHAMRDVLAPLASRDDVTVRPMDDGDGTQLCEVYPPATLATVSLPAADSGSTAIGNAAAGPDGTERGRDRRRTVVDGLKSETRITYAEGVRTHLLDDAGEDAIEAVIAALAADRARRAGFEPDRPWDPAEGHVYV